MALILLDTIISHLGNANFFRNLKNSARDFIGVEAKFWNFCLNSLNSGLHSIRCAI